MIVILPFDNGDILLLITFLKCKLSEYMKYFEIAIVVFVGSVKNELTFSNLHEIQITKLINH
jgi:DUF1009 family protein